MFNFIRRKLNEFIDYRVEIGLYRNRKISYDDIPVQLLIKRSDAAKQFPLLHTKKDGDVGYDLPAVLEQPITIYPGEKVLVPTGIHLEIPKGYWMAIEARSSTSKQHLIVPKGVIDEGYRGELFAQIINIGRYPTTINNGDRLAQLIPHRRYTSNIEVIEVNELSKSERGSSGFGSTGR